MIIDVEQKWLEKHALIFIVATAISLLPLYYCIKESSWQVLFFLSNLSILGICHGSLDHLSFCLDKLGKLRPGRFGIFIIAYLAVAGIVFFAWSYDPAAMLTCFLLISFIHFAISDDNKMNFAERIVWGGLPIFGPYFLHASQVTRLFAVLTGTKITQLTQYGPALQIIGFLAVGLACASVLIGGFSAFEQKNKKNTLIQISHLAMLLVYFLLPPLLSFTIYFCWWHSARECIHLIAEIKPISFRSGVFRFVKSAAPLTIASLFLGLGIFFCVKWSNAAFSEKQVVSLFFLLSALTVPHMFVYLLFSNKHSSA